MSDRTVHALTRDYLAEGPTTLADRVLDDAIRAALSRPQRRVRFAGLSVPASLRLVAGSAAALSLAVAVLAVGLGPIGSGTAPALARPIAGVWPTATDPVLSWRSSPDTVVTYLVATTYSRFEGDRWSTGEPRTSIDLAADDDLLEGTADWVDPAGRATIDVEITPARPSDLVIRPPATLRVDVPTTIEVLGDDRSVTRLTRERSSEPYVVTAIAPDPASENELRTAGTTYPPGLLDQYGRQAVPADAITTPEARALLDELVAAGGDNPYDLAVAAVLILTDPTRYQYDTDVRDLPCADLSVVDCFARYRRGYCEHFASTMAVLLRELGVPTRFVAGYLLGSPDTATGTWIVRDQDAHTWVQVYLPGHGWIDFDPTGGGTAPLSTP